MALSLGIADQLAAATASALVVPAPELAAFVVTGNDRLSWLNGMLTCDLAGKQPGDAVYGLQVGLKGRVVSDVVVVIDRERVVLFVQRSEAETIASMLDRHLMMEDALVEPAFDAWAAWLVHGPRSGEVLAAAREAEVIGGALDRTGLGGAILATSGASVPSLPEAVRAKLAGMGGLLGDAAGWEALRVAQGVPRFGADFDRESYPQEAGLEKTAVSFSKGCYLGQEVVCMLELRGHVKRKMVSLVVDGAAGAADVPPGATVSDEAGAPLGEVTSAAWNPPQGKLIALAMVKYARAKAGGQVKVGDRTASIVPAKLEDRA